MDIEELNNNNNNNNDGWIRDPVNEDEKFFVYADIDPNGNHVMKLRSRHSGHIRSPYFCYRCKEHKAYSNCQARIIKCENCNAEWTFEEMLNESNFRIKLGEQLLGKSDIDNNE